MDIIKTIHHAHELALQRKWDSIYWAIDLHGTISKFNYNNDDLSINYYPYSKETLVYLSKCLNYTLILYTCSYKENSEKIIELFAKDGIRFMYCNENPEAENTTYGDYTKKPYFNILLDDKAGFDPEFDWYPIYNYLVNPRSKIMKDNQNSNFISNINDLIETENNVRQP